LALNPFYRPIKSSKVGFHPRNDFGRPGALKTFRWPSSSPEKCRKPTCSQKNSARSTLKFSCLASRFQRTIVLTSANTQGDRHWCARLKNTRHEKSNVVDPVADKEGRRTRILGIELLKAGKFPSKEIQRWSVTPCLTQKSWPRRSRETVPRNPLCSRLKGETRPSRR